MIDVGLIVDFGWILCGDFSFDVGLQVGFVLLSQVLCVFVIFVVNDMMVMGVVYVVYLMGFSVFGDLLVVGFDDFDGVELFWLLFMIVCQLLGVMVEMVVEQLVGGMFFYWCDILVCLMLYVFICELVVCVLVVVLGSGMV